MIACIDYGKDESNQDFVKGFCKRNEETPASNAASSTGTGQGTEAVSFLETLQRNSDSWFGGGGVGGGFLCQ